MNRTRVVILGAGGRDFHAFNTYADVWASMGQESEREERARLFRSFQVNAALLSRAHPAAVVMYCLPAHRGEEITDEVLDGPQAIVYYQTEKRLHAQKALMALTI